jgi:glycosyltransferase involved in cell wall biosynthesis
LPPADTRVLREVTALAETGYEVDLVCVRKADEPARERWGPVQVWRLTVPDRGGGVARHLVSYACFFLSAAVLVGVLHLQRRFRLVQINTPPDALVFVGAAPRLLGARVLLDLQECMPEFFATKFGTGMEHPAVRLVTAIEQRSIRFADRVITPTVQLREMFIRRGADSGKISVVMDGADEVIFRPLPPSGPESDRFTLISHGTVEERYGLDTAIAAIAPLRAAIPGIHLKIYGDGSDLGRLRRLAAELGVADRVYFSGGFIPCDELVRAIANADIGVVAMKRDEFRDLTLASKMFDYVAMRVPMVVARTRSVEESFPSGSVELFDSNDPVDLARAIRRLYADRGRRDRVARHAATAAQPYRWCYQRASYLSVVNRLLFTS